MPLLPAGPCAYLIRKKFRAHVELAYGGFIARAENRAMVRLLNIDIHPLDSLNPKDFDVFALVDTQPRAGNNSFLAHLKASIVIDHHGARKASQEADLADIRLSYGSSATILTEYLLEAGLAIPKTMATALYLGLKTDTQNLGRHATDVDYKAAIALYPKVQLKILSQIEYPDLPRDYFLDFDRGLHEAKIYGKVIFCDLGYLANTDMVALMADFFLRFAEVSWSFVIGTSDSTPHLLPAHQESQPERRSDGPAHGQRIGNGGRAQPDGRGADSHPGHLPRKSGQDASIHSKALLKVCRPGERPGGKTPSRLPLPSTR